MLIAFIRTIIIYLVVMCTLRFLGKRQIGQLQATELVVALLISDFAALPLVSTDTPLLSAIVPIAGLVILEVIFSFISTKNIAFRRLMSGTPSQIITNGKINIDEMERLRLDLDELLQELRSKDIFDITDVESAILENGGQLSVIPKADKRSLTPQDMNISPQQEKLPILIISDGVLDHAALKSSGRNLTWLMNNLKSNNITDIKTVFIASLSADGTLFVQTKAKDPTFLNLN